LVFVQSAMVDGRKVKQRRGVEIIERSENRIVEVLRRGWREGSLVAIGWEEDGGRWFVSMR
jgi:hypothetical protein